MGPPAAVSVPVAIVRHWRENLRSSNSVRAIVAAITPCAVYDRGARDVPFAWAPQEGDALLYPGAVGVEPSAVRRLVVIDGTWKQARRVLYHQEGIGALPRFSLPARRDHVLRMRRPPNDEAMSTAEAVAMALRRLGDEAAAEHLEAVFDRQVAAIARMRGWET